MYINISATFENNQVIYRSSHIAMYIWKTKISDMKSVLTNKFISIYTRKRALECYNNLSWCTDVRPGQFQSSEMWFLQRLLRISWTAKRSIETVLWEIDRNDDSSKRQTFFFGRENVNHVTTRMVEGKDVGEINKKAK